MSYSFVYNGVLYVGSLEAITTEVEQMGLKGEVAIMAVPVEKMSEYAPTCCQMQAV